MQEAAADLAKIKKYALLLEEENARLKEELLRVALPQGSSVLDAQRTSDLTGLDNLINLYDRGFHVCNLYFGGIRQGDCLFCASFMKEDRP